MLTIVRKHISAEFEGDEYYKTEVRPRLEDGSAAHASIYVWQDSARHAAGHSHPCLVEIACPSHKDKGPVLPRLAWVCLISEV